VVFRIQHLHESAFFWSARMSAVMRDIIAAVQGSLPATATAHACSEQSCSFRPLKIASLPDGIQVFSCVRRPSQLHVCSARTCPWICDSDGEYVCRLTGFVIAGTPVERTVGGTDEVGPTRAVRCDATDAALAMQQTVVYVIECMEQSVTMKQSGRIAINTTMVYTDFVAMQVAAARHAQDEIRVRFQRLRASAVRLASFLSVAWQIIHKGKRQSPRARVIFVLVFFFLFSDGVTRDTPAIVLVPQLVDLAGLEINHGMFVKLAAMYDPKTMTRGRTKLHFFSQAVTTARNFICQTLRNDPSSRWQAIVPAVEALGVESCIDHRLLTSRARALLSEHS